jgi:transposase-like protein
MTKLPDQLELIPPYCPNPRCLFHFGDDLKFYVKNGWAVTARAPFRNQRFKCKSCETQFSANTFGLDFRRRIAGLSERILHYSMNGMSNNSIARLLNIAEGTVRNRLKEMARQSILFEKEHYPKVLKEDVAYDGFETFTHSQFSPCYINTAVGKSSHFIYHNTFSPLNRKGRMTEEQKERNKELIFKHGLFPQSSVYDETLYILKSLSEIGPGQTIYSDEHKSYARAYRSFDCKLFHETISSEARRNTSNPLFPINHLHMMYRHFFSSQQRETISFQKHEAALMDKIQLMRTYRNYMNPKFVKKNKYDPHAHEWSPGMYVEVVNRVLKFEDVFGIRKLKTQTRLNEKETAFMARSYPFSRQKIAG